MDDYNQSKVVDNTQQELERKIEKEERYDDSGIFAHNISLIPVATGIFCLIHHVQTELAGLANSYPGSVTVMALSRMLKGYVPPAKKRIERR